MENEEVIDQAINLGYEIPTEEEVQNMINGQKTDFMTTFAKKKMGTKGDSGSSSGPVGLVSNQRLKNKQLTGATNINNNPPEKPAKDIKKLIGKSNYKAQSKSAVVDIQDISNEAIEAVDRLTAQNSEEKKKPGIRSKYENKKEAKPNTKAGIYERKLSPNNPAKDKKGASTNSKKNVSTKSSSGAKSDRPTSGYQPKRNYVKPWQRPATAEDAKRNPKAAEANGKKGELARKTTDVSAPKKKQIRPVIVKKDLIDDELENEFEPVEEDAPPRRQRVSQVAPSIEVQKLEIDVCDKPEKNPQPHPKSANIAHPRSAYAMKKIKSVDVTQGLKIPLADADKDFIPRDKNAELVLVRSKSKNSEEEKHDKDAEKRAGNNAFQKIGDIKKRLKQKGNKSQDITHGYTDNNSGVSNGSNDDAILTMGHVDEVEGIKKSYVGNREEEKLGEYNLSGRSKGSSRDEYLSNEYEGEGDLGDTEDVENLFNYHDDHFDDNEDLVKTPFKNIGLDEINEEEELYDEDQLELKHAKDRIRDIEVQIKEKWEELIKEDDEDSVKK